MITKRAAASITLYFYSCVPFSILSPSMPVWKSVWTAELYPKLLLLSPSVISYTPTYVQCSSANWLTYAIPITAGRKRECGSEIWLHQPAGRGSRGNVCPSAVTAVPPLSLPFYLFFSFIFHGRTELSLSRRRNKISSTSVRVQCGVFYPLYSGLVCPCS